MTCCIKYEERNAEKAVLERTCVKIPSQYSSNPDHRAAFLRRVADHVGPAASVVPLNYGSHVFAEALISRSLGNGDQSYQVPQTFSSHVQALLTSDCF